MASKSPETVRPSPWAGRGLCVATAALWSTAGMFIKNLTALNGAGWDGWQVAGARSLLAGLTLIVLDRIWPAQADSANAVSAPNRRAWLTDRRQWIFGAIYAPTLLTYVLAQANTTTANAIFLQNTAPIYIMLCSTWLLREKPTTPDWLTLPALLAGIGLILSAELGFQKGAFGNAMGLLSGVGYAFVILLLRKWRGTGMLGGMALGNFMLAAVGMGAAAAGPNGLVRPDVWSATQIIWLGVFQIGLAYFLFQAALKRISAVEAALLALLEPVLCPLWAWLFAGDTPPARSLLGAGVILIALAAHTVWKAGTERRQRQKTA